MQLSAFGSGTDVSTADRVGVDVPAVDVPGSDDRGMVPANHRRVTRLHSTIVLFLLAAQRLHCLYLFYPFMIATRSLQDWMKLQSCS